MEARDCPENRFEVQTGGCCALSRTGTDLAWPAPISLLGDEFEIDDESWLKARWRWLGPLVLGGRLVVGVNRGADSETVWTETGPVLHDVGLKAVSCISNSWPDILLLMARQRSLRDSGTSSEVASVEGRLTCPKSV